jgi:outer membrane protein TolC
MRSGLFLPAISLLLALLPAAAAQAMPLDEAIDAALARDEGFNVLHARVAALNESAVADVALPDPELFLGAEGIPIDDPIGSDMMTMYMIGVRQQWPAGQTRRLSGERSLSQAHVLESELRARRLEIEREVRRAWLDWAAAVATRTIAEQGLDALDEMLNLAQSRYRAGSARQRDVDQARLERSLQAGRILDRITRVEDAASNLARWTGEWPDANGTPQLPDWPPPRNPNDLTDRLARHPIVEAEARRGDTGRIEVELARQAYRPMWMVEAGYGHQRGSDPMGGRMSDKFFGMVSMSLPLFTGNRQDRRVAAAEAEFDARVHQHQLRLQEWQGRLGGQIAALRNQQQRLELLEEIILPEAERTLESTLRAYRSDQATFDELVRARLAELDQRITVIETRLAWLRARTELAWLTAEEDL